MSRRIILITATTGKGFCGIRASKLLVIKTELWVYFSRPTSPSSTSSTTSLERLVDFSLSLIWATREQGRQSLINTARRTNQNSRELASVGKKDSDSLFN